MFILVLFAAIAELVIVVKILVYFFAHIINIVKIILVF
jgi:hypothetical protein